MSKIKYIFIITLYIISCYKIYENIPKETIIKNNNITIKSIPNIKEEQPIGNITINKINLNKPLFQIDSKKNNIEENITILEGSIEPDQHNSIFFLAAHSGTSNISFFNHLNKLSINDKIILNYKNINYTYYIKDIWETTKDGNIEIIKENYNQLILTTCSTTDKNKQLIINCIRKES